MNGTKYDRAQEWRQPPIVFTQRDPRLLRAAVFCAVLALAFGIALVWA
jgi:hypothetical protein